MLAFSIPRRVSNYVHVSVLGRGCRFDVEQHTRISEHPSVFLVFQDTFAFDQLAVGPSQELPRASVLDLPPSAGTP